MRGHPRYAQMSQLSAIGMLNTVDPLSSVSNYYVPAVDIGIHNKLKVPFM